MSEEYILSNLIQRHAHAGRLDWIGLRPVRKDDPITPEMADVEARGLVGDHHPSPGKRAVTLIQAEHLPVIAALSGLPEVAPQTLRRNLVISGINLTALRKAEIAIGTARLRLTGPCAPCSRMERLLGFGGYNAMRGHGGWTAEVTLPGRIAVGDEVTVTT
ncbi:MAG: MOSC domain-containing protein [Pseudomonadota bacterium]